LSAMDDPSPLEKLRRRLALAVGENAVFDGWTMKAVDSAAGQLGIDPVKARLAMPKSQPAMIDLYIQEIMAPAREAVRRALAILAMPQNVPLALRIGWRTADVMWRIAGDTSTDFNHYTKRMTLGAVYGSTLLVWLDDQSEGLSETAAFLDRRIDDVMTFEKWKAQWRGSSERRLSVSRFLGRLRYPPR
jgi:ubiquinone biosynthesis protein COQ9